MKRRDTTQPSALRPAPVRGGVADDAIDGVLGGATEPGLVAFVPPSARLTSLPALIVSSPSSPSSAAALVSTVGTGGGGGVTTGGAAAPPEDPQGSPPLPDAASALPEPMAALPAAAPCLSSCLPPAITAAVMPPPTSPSAPSAIHRPRLELCDERGDTCPAPVCVGATATLGLPPPAQLAGGVGCQPPTCERLLFAGWIGVH